MIKPQDLRIGNLVYDGGNYPENITEISLSDFYNMHEDNNCPFDGIPLTEEWLVKFGFKLTTESINGKWYILKDFEIHIDKTNTCYLILDMGKNIEIKYVNTLQNIWHALTDDELTI